ncbi:alpha/beta fold hydrolase [Streptomyces rhizosphaericus]|uniref:alpha/beta fold hydrolase n=1 Tax=Streptomyces rhizosphaericus TaxID=114699 RepID=UPI0035D45898
MHGWPFSSIEWRLLIPLLVQKGFTVIAPDLRGSGDSGIPAGHRTKPSGRKSRTCTYCCGTWGMSGPSSSAPTSAR